MFFLKPKTPFVLVIKVNGVTVEIESIDELAQPNVFLFVNIQLLYVKFVLTVTLEYNLYLYK